MREPHSIGIDVSLDRLDVAIRPDGQCFCVTNDAAGWAELVARVRCYATGAIGLEPSGGYERGVVRALLAAGLSVCRINPNRLRQFARWISDGRDHPRPAPLRALPDSLGVSAMV